MELIEKGNANKPEAAKRRKDSNKQAMAQQRAQQTPEAAERRGA